jgi:aryl-alcohol dehydrogenase-like predicted oxidoreductase
MSTKSIPQHKLGRDGPLVPALGFGLLPLSIAYGTVPDDEERFKLLDRAVELGSTFWDSAE